MKKGISSKEANFPDLALVDKGKLLYLSNLQKINLVDVINKPDVIRGGSRILKTYKMEFCMKTVKGWKL